MAHIYIPNDITKKQKGSPPGHLKFYQRAIFNLAERTQLSIKSEGFARVP